MGQQSSRSQQVFGCMPRTCTLLEGVGAEYLPDSLSVVVTADLEAQYSGEGLAAAGRQDGAFLAAGHVGVGRGRLGCSSQLGLKGGAVFRRAHAAAAGLLSQQSCRLVGFTAVTLSQCAQAAVSRFPDLAEGAMVSPRDPVQPVQWLPDLLP